MHPLSSLLSQRLEATFIQEPATHATSLLTNLDNMNNTLSHYTLSDAANNHVDEAADTQ